MKSVSQMRLQYRIRYSIFIYRCRVGETWERTGTKFGDMCILVLDLCWWFITQELRIFTKECLASTRCGLNKLTNLYRSTSFSLLCGQGWRSGRFTPGTKSVRTKRSEPRRRSNRVLQKVKRRTAAFLSVQTSLSLILRIKPIRRFRNAIVLPLFSQFEYILL